MPNKSSVVAKPPFYLKLLLLFMLLARTSAVSATSSAQKETRDVYESNTLDAAQNNVLVDRYLRDDAVNDATKTVEERGAATNFSSRLSQLAASIKAKLSRLLPVKLRLRWWRRHQKKPDEMFDLLNLRSRKDSVDLFRSSTFKKWLRFVIHEEGFDAEKIVFSTLVSRYDDHKLASMLQAAKDNHQTESFATNLQTLQFERWKSEAEEKNVFEALKLDKEDNFFLSPLFFYWADFIRFNGEKPIEVIINKQHPQEMLRRLQLLNEAKGTSDTMKNKLSKQMSRESLPETSS